MWKCLWVRYRTPNSLWCSHRCGSVCVVGKSVIKNIIKRSVACKSAFNKSGKVLCKCQSIYHCVTLEEIHYRLCKMSASGQNGTFTEQAKTIQKTRTHARGSVALPRETTSESGQFLFIFFFFYGLSHRILCLDLMSTITGRKESVFCHIIKWLLKVWTQIGAFLDGVCLVPSGVSWFFQVFWLPCTVQRQAL